MAPYVTDKISSYYIPSSNPDKKHIVISSYKSYKVVNHIFGNLPLFKINPVSCLILPPGLI